jgi:hypothetical protein
MQCLCVPEMACIARQGVLYTGVTPAECFVWRTAKISMCPIFITLMPVEICPSCSHLFHARTCPVLTFIVMSAVVQGHGLQLLHDGRLHQPLGRGAA